MFKIDVNMLRIYRDYQYDRANVYYIKNILKQPWPWVQPDHYLYSFKYTNVKRYLDKTTKQLIDNIIKHPTLSLENKILNIVLFRMFNKLEPCTNYLKNWPVDFNKPLNKKTLNAMIKFEHKAPLVPTCSAAYIMATIQSTANIYWRQSSLPEIKTKAVKNVFFVNFFKKIFLEAFFKDNFEDVVNILIKEVPSYGIFTGYQLVSDWSYMNESKYDDSTFCYAGPGAKAGIDWIISAPNVENKTIIKNVMNKEYPDNSYEDFIFWFENNISDLMRKNNISWNPDDFLHFLPKKERVWNVADIENSFCEFGKLNKQLMDIPARKRYITKL